MIENHRFIIFAMRLSVEVEADWVIANTGSETELNETIFQAYAE
jgi:hypothetical protein